MEQGVVDEYAARIHALLGEKLGVRGRGLDVRVRRAGRDLPRHVRQAAATLIRAERMAQDPKMCLRLDPDTTRGAFEICLGHLDAIDTGARKSKARFDVAAAVIVQVCVVCAATLGVLSWRGFL